MTFEPRAVDVTEDVYALGPSGIECCRPESTDEAAFITVTGPDGTPIDVPVFCSSPAARPPK